MPILIVLSCGSKEEAKTPPPVNPDSLALPTASNVAGIGRIEPEGGLIDLSSDQPGLIRQILAKEGDSVKKGAVLLVLDNDLQKAQLGEAGSRVQTEKAQVSVIRTQIQEAEANLRKAEQDLEKTRKLVERGAETRQKLDDAEADVTNKRILLQNQQANLSVSQKRINELNAQVNTARVSASRYTVNAPADGLILEVDAKLGQAITVGQTFAQLAPSGRLTALCEIDELFADRIAVGQKAIIRYKGYADTASTGEVIYAAPYLKKKSLFSDQVGEKEDRRVREVRVVLNDPSMLINRQVECVISLK